jgi:peptidyl-tRNA hydrolase, PTH1 family
VLQWLRHKSLQKLCNSTHHLADTENAYLIVGLGNPGKEYEATRHNIGFLAVDLLGDRWRAGAWSTKFGGQLATAQKGRARVLLLKPMGYMNLSGGPVQQTAHFYRVSPEKTVVVCDDVNLPFGQVRIRAKGGAGGHNGLKSVQQSLGTDGYVRIRLGVGGGTPGRDLTGHVLGRFGSEEKRDLDRILERCAGAVETLIERDLAVAMSQFNGSALETKE